MKNARAFLLIVTAASALTILAGCGRQSGSGAPASGQGTGTQAGGQAAGGAQAGAQAGAGGGRRFATIAVQAVIVQTGPLVTDNNTAGTVVPVTQSQVAAQVAGVVQKVLLNAGDFVKAGTTVVQLDDSVLRLAVLNAQSALDNARINLTMTQQSTSGSNPKLGNQLQSAQSALTSAQKNYASQKALYDLGGISSSQLDNAASQLSQAQANVDAAKLALDQNQLSDTQTNAQFQLAVDQATNQLSLAQLNLQDAAIKAPFTGQIASMNVTPGVYVSLNTSVFLLVSADKQINFSEPPTDAPNFKVGDIVQFNTGGKTYPVRITQTPSAPINGIVPMVASVPPGVPISYGTVGTLSYKVTIASGPQIPIAALQSRANTNFVDTVVNGKAVEQVVTIIDESGTTAVVSGLEAGTQVILNPPPGLINGSTVQVVTVPSAGQQGQAGTATGQQGQGGTTATTQGQQGQAGPGGQPQRSGSFGGGKRSGQGQSGGQGGAGTGQTATGGTP